ncbi:MULTISPECIES: Fe2+-dependent dioxygenase [Nitrincola]|uniref:PKHD-type hydroxylase n=1 Tax=Nitrincola nitratireducens TaxID=1229521 RepID=W9VNC4_9GAMM|nr:MULTISPECIES: Fe2+-dependent dioxygenase [Nitrincola]EXJ11990.1 PKHD-type hydroxylase [Nitrincola nitratireducens]
MLLHLHNILTAEEAHNIKLALLKAEWQDGKLTAGNASRQQKTNLQLDPRSPLAEQLGNAILQRLGLRDDFMAAALPAKIFPPMFNCYCNGGEFGYHIDNAIRQVPNTPVKIRTDLSMTLFLSKPDEYEGGELIIDDTFGTQSVKLPAGDLVLYPSTSLHRVTPVTKGHRISCFFWLQSLIRDNEQRRTLYQLDQSIQGLRQNTHENEHITRLIGVYHNLLRQWSQTS